MESKLLSEFPMKERLASRCGSSEVAPQLTDADPWALQLPSTLAPPPLLLLSQNCHCSHSPCSTLSKKKMKKKHTQRRRTLGTFHSSHIISVCPSKSGFHFLQASHRRRSVLIKVAYSRHLKMGRYKKRGVWGGGEGEGSQNQSD